MMEGTNKFSYCNQLISAFEQTINTPRINHTGDYYTGVDLGTSCIVISVLDAHHQPIAGAYQYANVVKDGMVVDYLGAINIVRELKEQLEQQLGTELVYCAAAIPPGTELLDGGAIRHVVEAAGFELTALIDEPTAANAVLKIENGAIVDIGGGTTGIAIIKNGKVILVDDQATGGTHFTLVVSGAYGIDFEEADRYKRVAENHRELLPILTPVIEKVASIISKSIIQHDVNEIYLVGGTCCLTNLEEIIEKKTKITTYKPANPMFVTPIGIALNCTNQVL
ncbi:ethanolamine utilization protein EutJ [Enterococcus sp. 22-H-5-01]|uniref:ethanolamine utilization protein EutJ n=1 Tax=Enterococcus sp. 22-H-5-01 TaxID=3418555 RepID=UPI003D003393